MSTNNAKIVVNKTTTKTRIGRKTITDEIAGGAYRKRATGYYVITDKDTSTFMCIFGEAKDGGKTWIALDIPYLKRSMTYKRRVSELELILPEAAKDYSLDSLGTISFGRLILSGDLAVDITKEYRQKLGNSDKVNNKIASEFLAKSKLATDLNKIFEPFLLEVAEVSVEKLFFTTKKDLYWASKIETEPSKVPEKILDCITWVKMKQK